MIRLHFKIMDEENSSKIDSSSDLCSVTQCCNLLDVIIPHLLTVIKKYMRIKKTNLNETEMCEFD